MYKKIFWLYSEYVLDASKIRLTAREKILFSKRLSLYLRTGIPLLVSLSLLADTSTRKNYQRMINHMQEDIRQGLPLSKAIAAFPHSFKKFHVHIITVGEMSGTLPQTISYLADILSRDSEMRRRIVGALIYPCIILVSSLVVCGFLIFYIFPKIVPLFASMHTQLPFTTRVLLQTSSFGTDHWLMSLSVITFFGILLISLLRSSFFHSFFDEYILRVPYLYLPIRNFNVGTIFRTISILLKSGARLDQSLSLSKESVSNQFYKKSLTNMEQVVLSGVPCSSAMKEFSTLYPAVAIQLIQAGEMTGTLSAAAEYVCTVYEDEFSEQISLCTTLIEPLLMLCMGIVVGFIAFAIITPMYGITQSLTLH